MSNKKLKIAIVWANPYNRNLGVGALAYSALAILNDVARENGIDAEFSFFGTTRSTSDKIVIDNKEIKFNNIYGLDFFSWKTVVKLAIYPWRYHIGKLFSFDYVFDIAEGDSFTDIYGDTRFWKILNSKRFFTAINKPQVLLPQTIGPFKNPVHEKAAFAAMKKLQLVISRDKQSYDYTSQFLPKDRIRETIDVAFYMPFSKGNFQNGKVNIGINVSGLLWNGGYTKDNQFNMKTDYKKLIRNTISFFSDQENAQVHLVPHVIPTDYAVEDDYAVSEELLKEFPNCIVSPRFDTPIDAKSYISGMDFFTGARMHACIAAFSTGVPVYPMAYSRKFNGLFGETLQYQHMGDCVNETTEVVFERLKQSFTNRTKLDEQIDLAHEQIIGPRIKFLKTILSETLNK